MKKSAYQTVITLIIVILILLFLSTKADKEQDEFRKRRLLMGTIVEITVLDKKNREGIESAVDAVFGEIERLEDLLGRHQEGSDIWRLNHSHGAPIQVSSETMEVIGEGLRFSEISKGAFDITLGRLMELWNFEGDRSSPPAQEEVAKALEDLGAAKTIPDRTKGVIKLDGGGRLDLGGIAKGYIIDRAAGLLVEHDIGNFILNAGGDMIVKGKKGDKPWRIGIQHPRMEGRIIAHIDVDEDTAIVTSGDYERYFIHNGRRYHHIIDPATGYPAEGLMSATIMADDAKTADAICTAAFVLGAEEGMRLINSIEGVDGMLVDADERIHLSEGMKNKVIIK